MSKEILITYPHGLGDCIMLTPAIREYHKKHGVKVNIAIMKRFESSEIFKNCPYVKKVYYVPDPWNDFKNSAIGFREVVQKGKNIASNNGIPKAIFLNQPPPTHKIIKNAQLLGLNLSSNHMDVFISDADKKVADGLIKKLFDGQEYGFIQTKTGAGAHKDLPDGFGRKFLEKHKGLKNFIEIGKTFKYNDYNINVQFELLRRSSGVCIPDSVFYHAASALDKDIDFVYFGRGESVYQRVGNLNKKIIEKVHYKIPLI